LKKVEKKEKKRREKVIVM